MMGQGLTVVREQLLARFAHTCARTEALAAKLSAEDQQLQSMPDASPTKWHRAHTTWFFEAFVLVPAGVEVVDRRYELLFNSYYDTVGARHPRPKRGLLSRPSVAEVADYRRIVDERVVRLLSSVGQDELTRLQPILELGIAHEEQHQELLLTDILHAFSQNPLRPIYDSALDGPLSEDARGPAPLRFVSCEGGLREIGASADAGFAFDNERPRHKRYVEPFMLADRLVPMRDLKAFIDEGGYRTPALWLSDGFDFVRANALTCPIYSTYEDGRLHLFTLAGPRLAHDDEPAVHVSYYEADAIARFLGARLATEAEWEMFAIEHGPRFRTGDAWEWTQSSYDPYPGYVPPAGALGEYNAKFMVSQIVLRGGSRLTPKGHVRPSYRNFWPPATRFQRTGIRLARGVAR